MPELNGRSKVLPIAEDTNVLELIRYYLKDEDDFLFIEQSNLSDGIQPIIASHRPNVVLLDFSLKKSDTYRLIDSIATQFPDISIIVILHDPDTNVQDDVILSGARAFIIFPFAKEKLLATLRRVVELSKRNLSVAAIPEQQSSLQVKQKNTYTVFSPKGGTGCTTIAINLAIALQHLTKEPVLLVDGKPIFGDVALMLNIRTTNSIIDLVSHADMLDGQLIRQVVVDHVSGIKVLPSPMVAAEAQGIHAEALFKVVTELQETYPVIVVDGGNYLHDNTITFMDCSEKIIVVLNPNLASIRDVRQFMDICQTLSYPKEKIILVLNNTNRKTDIRHDEIEKIIKQKIIYEIQGDDNLFLASLNEGIPAMVRSRRHPSNRAIQKLAVDIENEISERKAAI